MISLSHWGLHDPIVPLIKNESLDSSEVRYILGQPIPCEQRVYYAHAEIGIDPRFQFNYYDAKYLHGG